MTLLWYESKIYFENILKDHSRYPRVNLEDFSPEVVFLPDEPFKFSESDQREVEKQFPKAKVIFVSGKDFSWYGSRPIHSLPYLSKHFSHGYEPKKKRNVSENKGYKHYCDSGEISIETQELIESHPEYLKYSKYIRY